MAIPLSTSPYLGQLPPEYDESREMLDNLPELIEDEAAFVENPAFVKNIGGDTTSFSHTGAQKFITEQLISVAALASQQTPVEQQAVLKSVAEHQGHGNGSQALPSVLEDKNITANYLFSLNPLNQVKLDMQKNTQRRSPNRQLKEHSELLKFIREEQREAQNDDQEQTQELGDLGPMIEALTNELPQVSMELPGGVTLRFAIARDGKVSVMYETPEGQLRTLPKGKTLRLSSWVNGLTVRTDGTIALTP